MATRKIKTNQMPLWEALEPAERPGMVGSTPLAKRVPEESRFGLLSGLDLSRAGLLSGLDLSEALYFLGVALPWSFWDAHILPSLTVEA